LSADFGIFGALMTFAFGTIFAIHFFLDLFPERYQGGYAYIHFPIINTLT